MTRPALSHDGIDPVPSYYAATAGPRHPWPALEGDLRADVAVLGAGFAGLNAALELAQRGFTVAIVEAHRVGWGCSGRNGGQVINGIADFDRLRRALGEDDARIAWDMGIEGMEIVYRRVAQFGIDCDLKRGYFNAACNRRQMHGLREYAERQARMGYPYALETVERDALPGVIGSDAYVGGVLDPGSGHVHPLNLCLGEAAAAGAAGVRIFEGSAVRRVVPGRRPRIETDRGSVSADHVIIAGNAYLDGLVKELRGMVLPAGSYIIATEPLPERLAEQLLPRDSAVCDDNVLLDYFRLSADRRLLFGGRCNYTGRQPRDIKSILLPRMLKVFPQLRGVRIDYQWGGTVAVSLKRIPQLGRLPGNILYAQGYTGHGIVATHIAGRLLAEVVAGQAGRFDVLARIRHRRMPGGRWLGTPALALGMTWYRLLDML